MILRMGKSDNDMELMKVTSESGQTWLHVKFKEAMFIHQGRCSLV